MKRAREFLFLVALLVSALAILSGGRTAATGAVFVDNATVGGNTFTTASCFSRWWWDGVYRYRQRVTVTTGSAAVTSGYSVQLNLNHAQLVQQGKSLTSGDDLRLLYWNQGNCNWSELDRVLDDDSGWNNASTRIWFRTQAAISANSSDNNYYLYYGNNSATNPPANRLNVFLFHDDFPGSSIDTSKWTVTRGSATVSGGLLTLNANSSIWATSSYAFGGNTRWEARIQLSTNTVAYFNYWGASNQNGYDDDYITFWTDASKHFAENSASGLGGATNVTFSANTPTSFHIYIFNREGTSNVRYFQDTTQVANITTGIPTANLRVFVWNDNSTQTQRYDWVRVRHYVNPEPSTALGAEEPAP
jgi:hypothetical protein